MMGSKGKLEGGAFRSRKQISAARRNIKKAQKESPAAKAKPNVYTNGRDFDLNKQSVESFMTTHNRAQRIYMHSILHAPSAKKGVPYRKRKALHDAIVRRDIREHKSPM